jgi:hypothetical protein
VFKCSGCFRDGGHRFAVERKIPTVYRLGNEDFVAAGAPCFAASVGSRVSRPQACLATAERCGGSRCGRRGHFGSFQSLASFVRIEDVDYGATIGAKPFDASALVANRGAGPTTITLRATLEKDGSRGEAGGLRRELFGVRAILWDLAAGESLPAVGLWRRRVKTV